MECMYSSGAVKVFELSKNGLSVECVSVTLPVTGQEILIMRAPRGMLLCGIFSQDMLEQLGLNAAVIRAASFEDLLSNRPVFLTGPARALGANPEMSGFDLLRLFM